MGGLGAQAMKVIFFALAAALSAGAAPVPEGHSLYEQTVALYDALLQEGGDDKPFEPDIQTGQEKVFKGHNTTIGHHDELENTKRLVPFEVSDARDKAIADESKKQEDAVAKATKTYLDSQNATAKQADDVATAADKKASDVSEAMTEKIHSIMHPDDAEKEKKDTEFYHQIADQAAGRNVIISDGDQFEPDGAGDVPPSKLAMLLQDMRAAEKQAYATSQAMFDEALDD